MKHFICILTFSALTASSAFAQVTGPSYDFDKLEALWANVAAPNSSWYNDLKNIPLVKTVAPTPTPTPTATPTPMPSPTPTATPGGGGKTRNPRPDVGGTTAAAANPTTPTTPVVGTGTAPEPTASYKFPVLAPVGALASDIYAKSARIEMYLAAERYFSGLTMTPQEEQGLSTAQKDERRLQRFQLVKQRALSANLELYLIKLSRYFEASQLTAKCTEMKAADKIYSNALSKIKNADADLLPQWVGLYNDLRTLIETTQNDSQRFYSCNLLEVNSKGETINRIRDIVSTAVTLRLRDKVAKEISFFQSQTAVNNCGAANLTDLQKLSCMGERLRVVQLPVEETFDLARQVRDVKANLDMISAGYEGIRGMQTELREKAGMDPQGRLLPGNSQFFPKLGAVVQSSKDPTKPGQDLAAGAVLKDEKIINLEKSVQSVNDSLKTAMQVMGSLQTRFNAPETQICANLSTRLNSLNPADDGARNVFVSDVKTCVLKMTDVVNTKLNSSDNDRMQSLFVSDLTTISKIILDNLKSLDSSDNGGGFDNF